MSAVTVVCVCVFGYFPSVRITPADTRGTRRHTFDRRRSPAGPSWVFRSKTQLAHEYNKRTHYRRCPVSPYGIRVYVFNANEPIMFPSRRDRN